MLVQGIMPAEGWAFRCEGRREKRNSALQLEWPPDSLSRSTGPNYAQGQASSAVTAARLFSSRAATKSACDYGFYTQHILVDEAVPLGVQWETLFP